VLESQSGVDGAAVEGQGQATSVLSGQQQAINLGRLKEFCLDVAEKVAPAAIGTTGAANPADGAQKEEQKQGAPNLINTTAPRPPQVIPG
jgi:hypothetical protein